MNTDGFDLRAEIDRFEEERFLAAECGVGLVELIPIAGGANA
ncbi:hypothetical protein [Mesorhizobium sp.]|nr:hypothetical protein [Mesorhizobium sp.]